MPTLAESPVFDPFQALARAASDSAGTMPLVVLSGASRGLPEADWPIILRAADVADLLVAAAHQ